MARSGIRQPLWIGVIVLGVLGGVIGAGLLAAAMEGIEERRIGRQAQVAEAALTAAFERTLAGAQGLAAGLGPELPGLTRDEYQTRVLRLVDAGVLASDRSILSLGQRVGSRDVQTWRAALPDEVAQALDLRPGGGDEHVFLTHTWPYDRGPDVFGVDVLGLEVPGPVAATALRLGEARVTPPVRLLGERGERTAMVAYLPLQDDAGVANGVLVVGVVIDALLEDLDLEAGRGLLVLDVGTGAVAGRIGVDVDASELQSTRSMSMLDRELTISVGASDVTILSGLERALPWVVGAIGLAVAALGAVGLADGRRRAASTAEEVAERTTELRRAQELLLQRNAELATADRIKDEVLAVVSHDLRTPVTVISGLAELLQHDPSLSDIARDALVRIGRQSGRVEDLVQDLLTAAQTQGRGARYPEVVDLVAAAEALLTDLRLDVRVDGPDRALAVSDPDHLDRILANLLTNAQRYGAPPIEVAIRRSGELWELRVRDHGGGIEPGDEGPIFDPFHQVGRTRQGGVGLGLTIALRLARANGGDVRYETPDGAGACFVVTLPVAVAAEPGPLVNASGV